jgi:large subunit ribosomal protein L15
MKMQDLERIPLHQRRRKIVGRGTRSGHGKTCGRGHKGAKARSGGGKGYVGYEGGQTPLFRRLPKRGFSNARFRLAFAAVNVGELSGFAAGSEVTPEALLKAGVIRKPGERFKVLGGGALGVPLKVHAHRFSSSAAQKIREAGGETILLRHEGPPARRAAKGP